MLSALVVVVVGDAATIAGSKQISNNLPSHDLKGATTVAGNVWKWSGCKVAIRVYITLVCWVPNCQAKGADLKF